jgi:hypothetical protein
VPKAQVGHRLGFWTVLATVVGGVVLGVGLVLLVIPSLVTDGRPQPVALAEELVRTFILDNSRDQAGNVEFLTFGPHMSRAEIEALFEEAGTDSKPRTTGDVRSKSPMRLFNLRGADAVIRVRYFAKDLPPFEGPEEEKPKDGIHDELFLVSGKEIAPAGFGSDDWKLKLRDGMSKVFSGVRRFR